MTPTDAWDYIHRLFGVGGWAQDHQVEVTAHGETFTVWVDATGKQWYEHRREMGTRLKGRLTKLAMSPEEACVCADYCKAHGINIENAVWVTKYYYEAKTWARERDNERARVDIADRISEAVSTEMEHDKQSPWISKLLLAQGKFREEVLIEWTSWNQNRPSPSSSRSAGAGRLQNHGGRTA